jgi:hypothetical protein
MGWWFLYKYLISCLEGRFLTWYLTGEVTCQAFAVLSAAFLPVLSLGCLSDLRGDNRKQAYVQYKGPMKSVSLLCIKSM